MLSPRRTSIEDSEPAVLRNNSFSPTQRYPSTPHLDVFLVANNGPSEANGIITTNNYMMTPLHSTPKLSTFSTSAHHKSGVDLRYKDDPNPYKVSNIDEFKIQTNDPYRTKSTHQLNAINQLQGNNRNGIIPYYNEENGQRLASSGDSPLSSPGNEYNSSRSAAGLSRLSSSTMRSYASTQYENDSLKKFYQGSEASQNSGEYEIPDPDYEDADGSTGGSSEELPLPPPLPRILNDSSEEYSQLSISASSNSGGLSPSPLGLHENESRSEESPIHISDADRRRIECGFLGRKTMVFVADALANLYYKRKTVSTPAQRPQMPKRLSQDNDWNLAHVGVPVLLFDTGETKSRDKRKIQIVLADLHSGLALWKDVIDNLSSYEAVDWGNGRIQGPDGSSRPISTFHTMHVSSDHTKLVGLSFDNAESADKFALKVEKLTSDFANISLSGAKSKAKKKEAKLHEKNKAAAAKKYVRPKKSEISQPCCFQHVSSLNSNDRTLFSTLHQFISPKILGGSNSPESKSSDISF